MEDLGGLNANLRIPNTFPENEQVQEFTYSFVSTNIAQPAPPDARWASGSFIDGKG